MIKKKNLFYLCGVNNLKFSVMRKKLSSQLVFLFIVSMMFAFDLSAQTVSLSPAQCGQTIQYGDPIFCTANDSATEYEFKFFTKRDTVIINANRNYLLVDEYRNKIRTHVNFNIVIRCKFGNDWGQYGDTCSSLIYVDGFEELLAKFGRPEEPAVNTRSIDDGSIYEIPIVFHVLVPDSDPNSYLADYLPPEKIYESLQILNDVFSGKTGEEYGDGVDTRIRFCIAKKDNDGNEIKVTHNGQEYYGITYFKNTSSHINGEGLEYPLEEGVGSVSDPNLAYYNRFPREKYLNIFVYNSLGKAAGMAWSDYFGRGIGYVKLAKRYIGTNEDPSRSLGYSLPHEVGHFFGLYHTWHSYVEAYPEDTDPSQQNYTVEDEEIHPNDCHCDPNEPDNYEDYNSCITDFVDDTPCHLSASHDCDAYTNEPITNIMNYAPDGCRRVFTQGQKNRMRGVISSSYRELAGLDINNNVETLCIDDDDFPPSILATRILSPSKHLICPDSYNSIEIGIADVRLLRRLEIYKNSVLQETYTYNTLTEDNIIDNETISIQYNFNEEGFYRINVYTGRYKEVEGHILDTDEDIWHMITHSMRVVECNSPNVNNNQAQWFFDKYVSLDFRNGIAQLQEGSRMNADKSESSICDNEGNLLFYTDGTRIWNKEHHELTGQSEENILSKSTIALKFSDTKYAVLSTTETGTLTYRIINVNGSNYTISSSDIGNITNIDLSAINCKISCLTAVPAMEEGKYWLLSSTMGPVQVNPVVMKIWLDSNGNNDYIETSNLHTCEDIEIPCGERDLYARSIKVSPSSEYVVYCAYAGSKFLRFNAATGDLFDYNCTFGVIKQSNVAFSPSGRFLYVASVANQHIVQYDLYNMSECDCPNDYITIFNPRMGILGDYTSAEYIQEFGSIVSEEFQSEIGILPSNIGNYIQEGPDGRVYFSVCADNSGLSRTLGVIRNPDVLASLNNNNECGVTYPFILYDVSSPYYNHANLPNFVDAINIDTCKVKFIVCSHNCSDIKIENMSLGFARYQWTFRRIGHNGSLIHSCIGYNPTDRDIRILRNILIQDNISSFIVRLEKLNSPNAPACENAYMEKTISFDIPSISISGPSYICNNGDPAIFGINPTNSFVSASWTTTLNEYSYHGLEHSFEYAESMPENFTITVTGTNTMGCQATGTKEVEVRRITPNIISIERDCNSYPLTYTITIGNVTEAWAKIQSMEDYSWVSDDENNTIIIYISNIQIENLSSEHSVAYLPNLGASSIVLPISVFDNISGCEYALEADLPATPVAQQLEVSCDGENPHSIFVIHNVGDEDDIRIETNLDGYFIEGYEDFLVYRIDASSCDELNGSIVSIYYENGSENTECLLYMGSAGQTEPLTVAPTQINEENFNCISQIVYSLPINISGGLPPYIVTVEEEGGSTQNFTIDQQGENIIDILINPPASGSHNISFTITSYDMQQYTWNDIITNNADISSNLLNINTLADNNYVFSNRTLYVAPEPLIFTHDATFKECTIYCAYTDYDDIASTQWTVNSGNTVTFNQCTIMSGCPDKMWQGIKVIGETITHIDPPLPPLPNDPSDGRTRATALFGKIRCDNTTIEDAIKAIESIRSGKIIANGSHFNNNQYDLYYNSYVFAQGSANAPTITNCTFTTTRQLNDNTIHPTAHISMKGTSGMFIRGCTFENTLPFPSTIHGATNTGYNRGMGIEANTSHIDVSSSCSFKKLFHGVHASGFKSKAVVVENSSFTGNHRAIYINNNDGCKVLNNNIVSRGEPGEHYEILSSAREDREVDYSVFIGSCHTFTFEQNTISNATTGLYVYNSGNLGNQVRYNTFEGRPAERTFQLGLPIATKPQYNAIVVVGENSSYRSDGLGSRGLEVLCNTFRRNTRDIFIKDGYMRQQQGSNRAPTGNSFLFTDLTGSHKQILTQFSNTSMSNQYDVYTKYDYYQHDEEDNDIDALGNIHHLKSGCFNPNKIDAIPIFGNHYTSSYCQCSDGTGPVVNPFNPIPFPGIDRTKSHIQQLSTTLDSAVNEYETKLDGGNTANALMKVSAISQTTAPSINDLPQDGYLSDTVCNALVAKVEENPVYVTSVFVENSPLPSATYDDIQDAEISNILKTVLSYYQSGENKRVADEKAIGEIKQEISLNENLLYDKALNDSLSDTDYAIILDYFSTKTDVDSKIMACNILTSSENYDDARQKVSDIRSLGTAEAINCADVMDMYINTMDTTMTKEMLKAHKSQLENLIADDNYLYSGIATTLYEYAFDTIIPEYTPIYEEEFTAKSTKTETASEIYPYAIYPNPTSDFINIELASNVLDDDIIEFLKHYGINNIEDCETIQINIFDVNSRLVNTGKYKYDTLISIDVKNYPSGTYLVEIKGCYDNVMQTKIVKL